MKKICIWLVLCLLLTACPAFAEVAAETSALLEQAQAAIEAEDYETAVPLIRKAAEAGDATGLLWLGNCYSAGLGVEQDDGEAVKYYQLAAEQGNLLAEYNLAFCYMQGIGVEQDA